MKNKKNKGALHLMLALCTMGSLAACSSDDVMSNINETDNTVKIAVSTRNGETGTAENPWIENDIIALSAIGHQLVTYQWNGSDWSSKRVLCWPNEQTKCNFMGYYPITATNDGLSFTIPTDQSDAAKLHAADYMTTDRLYDVEKPSDPANQQIDFNFRHRLAKVVINITSYDSEFDAAAPTLSGENIFSQGSGVNVTANTANGSLSTVDKTGSVVWIKPFKGTNKEGKTCYTALVSPATIDNNSMLMAFYVDDDIRYVTYPNTLERLESGKAYIFNVKVGRDKVEVGGVNVTDWNEKDGGNYEDNMLTLAQLLTDSYKSDREAMNTLILNGPTLDQNAEPNCWGENFATYFPNVTTLIITGTTIPSFREYSGILYKNSTVKTVIGNDITSLPDRAFDYVSGVTTYTFPNLTEAGSKCFELNGSLKEISLPKLKALSMKLFYVISLDKACFASLTDFSEIYNTFTEVNHLAFGSKEEFTFADNMNPADMYYYNNEISATDRAAKTTLYLDENGFEYKSHVSKEDSTIWRGTKFKAIKKYSEYPGKKD